MKNVYIINSSSVGANYGIGTYIKQIREHLNTSKICLTIIHLYSEKKAFHIEIKNNIRYIEIPGSIFQTIYKPEEVYNRFCRNVAFLLMPYINNNQENIFHLNYINQFCLARELRKRFNCKIFLTVHYYEWAFLLNGDRERLKSILERRDEITDPIEKQVLSNVDMEKKLFDICDRIITVAHHSAETLKTIYKIHPSKIFVLHNALFDRYNHLTDNDKKQLRKQFYIDNDEKIILFVGRPCKLKGYDFLLDFFKLILEKYPRSRLMVVGWDNSIYSQIQKAHSIWTRVTLTGFLEQNDLNQIYRIADIGIVPSIYEEFGYVATEMMMYNIPVFVNNTTGLKEIMQNNPENIFDIKEENSPQILATKISYLLSHETERIAYGDRCRHIFKQMFDFPQWKEKLLNIYLSE